MPHRLDLNIPFGDSVTSRTWALKKLKEAMKK
jgi:hypothetical protein